MKRLELLDYARLFAAVIVVLFHYTFNGIANGKVDSISHIPGLIDVTKYGFLGVELFFMISGYVIFFSAKTRSPSAFAVSRMTRLYPAFWFAVLFTAAFIMLWGGDTISVTLPQVLANLTMIQPLLGFEDVDGVYWTLLYELKFYFLVFMVLMLGLQSRLEGLFQLWPVLFAAAWVLNLDTIPYLGSYYYYFAAGALFAMLKEKTDWKTIVSLLITYGLCVQFTVDRTIRMMEPKGFDYSAIGVALAITACFAFFAYQNTRHAASLRLPFSKLAGGLTYPIYLLHAHFGYLIFIRFANDDNKVAIYLITSAIVVTLAYLVHQIIENKLHLVWKNLINNTVGVVLRGAEGMLTRSGYQTAR